MIGRNLGKRALWARAIDYVKEYNPTLIGVTGSYGKTLTKEAIALALKDTRHVRASHKSYNTPIGVALSILGQRAAANTKGWISLLAGSKMREITEAEPDTIVLEVGADHPGDIDWIVKQLPFNIAVVTNVGSTHLQYFVSKEMVAHEKLSLPISLPEEGTAILNIDDLLVAEMAPLIKKPTILTYGTSQAADIHLARIKRLGIKGFACEVVIDDRSHGLSLPSIAAEYQIYAALAAIAVASTITDGKDLDIAIKNLTSLKPPPGRMEVLNGKNGSTILDDSFNAAPESVAAALDVLKKADAKRKIVVLGDMLSLGGDSIPLHTQLGKHIAKVADVFVAVGPDMKHAQTAVLESEQEVDTHHFPDSRDVGKWFEDYIKQDDLILIKGSHNMHMDEVVKRLKV